MNTKHKGLLFISIFSVFWAVEIILTRYGLLLEIEPLSFLFQVSVFAFFLLTIYNLKKPKEFSKARGNIKKIFLIGIFGSGIANLLTYFGLKLSTAVNYGFIIRASLVFTVILAYFFLKEPLHKEKIILMFILLIGVYLVTTKGALIIPKIGDILIILAAFFYSLQAIIAKSILRKVPASITANIRLFFGLLFLLPIAYFINRNLFFVKYIGLVVAVAVTMGIGLILLYKTLEIKSASYMTMMTTITPIIVAILSLVLLKESINVYQIAGGTLIILSAILIHRVDI